MLLPSTDGVWCRCLSLSAVNIGLKSVLTIWLNSVNLKDLSFSRCILDAINVASCRSVMQGTCYVQHAASKDTNTTAEGPQHKFKIA